MKTTLETKASTNETLEKYPEDEKTQLKNFDPLKFTHAIEEQTGKLPWVSWVGLAAVSLGASAALIATDRKHFGIHVGLLAPCFLLMGVYNKIAKIDAILENEPSGTVHSSVH